MQATSPTLTVPTEVKAKLKIKLKAKLKIKLKINGTSSISAVRVPTTATMAGAILARLRPAKRGTIPRPGT